MSTTLLPRPTVLLVFFGQDPKTKQTLYYSLVRPGLEFASVCFSSLTVTHETRIERIQSKCIRFLGNNVFGSEVNPLVSLKNVDRLWTWLSCLNVSILNSPVIYVLCLPLRYPVPISVIQICSLSLTIGSMLPETVSYTAWLRCISPKPSLHSNWKLIKCYTPPSPSHFHPCRAQSLETSFNLCQICTC